MKKKIIVWFMLMCLLFPMFLGLFHTYVVIADEQIEKAASNSTNLPLVQNPSIEPVVSQPLKMLWLTEKNEETTFLNEVFDQETWNGTLCISGEILNNEQSELQYIIDMGMDFKGILSSKNPNISVRKLLQVGQWEIHQSLSISEKENYRQEIDVVVERLAFNDSATQSNVLNFHSIRLIYEGNNANTEKLTLSLKNPIDILNPAETIPINPPVEETTSTNRVEQKKSFDSQIVANLLASEVYSNTTPLAGEYFDMTVRINSASIADSEEPIKNMQLVVVLPDCIDIVTLPESNIYRVKTEKIGANTQVTIDYLKELSVGKMLSIPFGLRFKKGISLPTMALEGLVKVTSSNANSTEKQLDGIQPKINAPTNHLIAEKDPDATPIEVHVSKIHLIPEAEVGGVNIKNSILHIEFPNDIELYSVNYQGINYPVKGPLNGVYSVDIMISDFNVMNGSTAVELTYQYPYSTTGKAEKHEIKATLTGTRLDGTAVYDEVILPETVPAIDDLSGYPGIKFFTKTAPNKILKEENQTLTYTLTFSPRLEMRDAYLVDDPVRNTDEPDFFEGFRYQSFSWSAQKSKNPTISGLVSTELFYQTKKNAHWQSMGASSLANTIQVASLGLAEDDYVTTVKYVFTYQGSTKLPKDAGKVSISAVGKTTAGVKNSNLSLEDGLTNTLHIYGDRKHANAPESSYEAFVNGGYEENNDDANNTKTATTALTGKGAYPGYYAWEQPFSPKINDIGATFTYQIGVNNVFGSSSLKDAILYITVPTSINIENVELLNPQNDPNAQIEIKQIDDKKQLVTIRYHNDWSNNEGWNFNHGVKITASGSENISTIEEFNNYLVSGDPLQTYDDGTAWILVPGVGYRLAALSKERKVIFNRSIGLDSKKEVSEDGVHFSRFIQLQNQENGTELTYRLTVPNNGAVKVDELHIIDHLPSSEDTMAISANPRHSTVGGQLKSITLADGTPLNENYELFYSLDATAENNLFELKNLTNSQSTWQVWDGQTPLDEKVTAVKIIKTDGLASQQEVSFLLSYHIPKVDCEIETIWNSFAVGGSYVDGATAANLEVGEPIKSGVYLGQSEPTKKIAGNIWSDENANGVREDSEAKIEHAEVSLYDWNNDLVSTTKTKADGSYSFDQLYNRRYRVTVKRVNSTNTLTTYQTGSDKKIDNDFLEMETDKQFGERVVDLSTEEHPLHIDGGYTEPTTINGLIWYDDDRDGLQSAGEHPASDVSVTLYKIDDTRQEVLVKTVSTGVNGKYYFTGSEIKPGKYQIRATLPTDYAVTIKGETTETQNSKFNIDGSTDMISVKKGDNSDWDLGLVLDLPTYTKIEGNKIWVNDLHNLNQRPESIQVQIFQDGKEYGQPLTVQSNQTNQWQFAADGLPEYHTQSNQKYVYAIKELDVPLNYTSRVEQDTFTIINTRVEDETINPDEIEDPQSDMDSSEVLLEKNDGTSSNMMKLPRTGEKTEFYLLIGILIVLGITIYVLIDTKNYKKIRQS